MIAEVPVTLTVNGETIACAVAPNLLLVEFLRGALGLTGAHVGCDTSQCGACTTSMVQLFTERSSTSTVQAPH